MHHRQVVADAERTRQEQEAQFMQENQRMNEEFRHTQADLAEKIRNVDKALKFCKYLRGKFSQEARGREGVKTKFSGSCTPSLISREGRCFQWSPLDGEAG